MYVGMSLQVLSPSVQHRQKTDLGSQMLGISSHLQQRLGTGAHEQVVNHCLVLQCQAGQLMGQRKNKVEVVAGEQFLGTCSQPLVASIGLTFWAMPVSAGVELDGLMSAFGTRIHMCAECGGTATQDRIQHLEMQPGEPLLALRVKALSGFADHIGHLNR